MAREAQRRKAQHGAALAFVLALVAVASILVGLGWRMFRADNALAGLDRGEAQARLLALSGLEYALAKIGPPGPGQNLSYGTDGLDYHLDDSDRAFRLTVKPHALFARAVSTGKSGLPRPGRASVYDAVIGQSLDLGRLPAVGLLNHEGNMVLAGNAQVTGPVMLWRGDVRKATDYHIRFSGGAGLSGPTWDSTAKAWPLVKADFSRAAAWMAAQEMMLASRDFSRDADFDSGAARDVPMPDSAVLTDSVAANARFIGGAILRVGNGVRLKDCKLVARRIAIEGDASLERCTVLGLTGLAVKGGRIRGGQFLAGDTLIVESDRLLEGYPVFYAQGRMRNRGKPDSAQVGALWIKKASGRGVFLSACKDSPPVDQEVRLAVERGAKLTGLVYTPCIARMEGDLTGAIICRNFKFEAGGTIWLGHLKDAHIASMSGRGSVPAPLMFPGFAPAAYPGKGPE